MSFASPVFWKIQDLANNITKKNIKSTVAELNQLLKLYGPEARQFLLACLIHKVEVRDQRGLSHKIQLLNHEITELSLLPNFPTVIREAFRIAQALGDSRARRVTEEYLAGFCKQVKLNITQQILVAVGLEESDDPSIAHQAVLFLKKTIPELGQASGGGQHHVALPKSVVHTLLRIVRTNPEFKPSKFEQACTKALLKGSYSKLATGGNAASSMETRVLMPLLEDDFSLEYRGDMQVVENGPLSEDIFKSLSIASFILDIGYTCATSQSNFETTILKFGKVSRRSDKLKNTAGVRVFSPLTERDVADILRCMAHTLSSLKTDCSATLDHAFRINRRQNSWDFREPNKQLSSWNMHVVASSLSSANFPSLDWNEVLRGFDHPDFDLPNADAFAWLIQVFRKASGMKATTDFPLDVLYEPWNNPRAQLSFLKFAIGASPSLFAFSHCASQLSLDAPEGRLPSSSTGTPNGAWRSLRLLSTLLELANRGDCYGEVRALLHTPAQKCPIELLLGLVTVASPQQDWSGLFLSTIQTLLPTFLWPSPAKQQDSTLTLQRLWAMERSSPDGLDPQALIMNGIDAMVKQEPSAAGLERAVAVLAKFEGGFDKLFNSPTMSDKFKIDVACEIASYDDALGTGMKLSSFLASRLSEPEDARAEKAKNQAHGGDLTAMTRPSSRMLFLRTCLAWLQQRKGELKESVLVEFHRTVRNYRSLMDEEMHSMYKAVFEDDCALYPALQKLEGPDVAEQANAYFQQLYTKQLPIDKAVDMLRQHKNSADPREREIFACMIRNLFEEFQHLPNYPDRELQFTGTIFGALVRHQLVKEMNLGVILRYVLEALQRAPPDKMYFFGFKALEQFMSRLHEWPKYCNLVAAIPHLKRHPEVSAFIQSEMAKATEIAKQQAGANANAHSSSSSSSSASASASGKNTQEAAPAAAPAASSTVNAASADFVPQDPRAAAASTANASTDKRSGVPDFIQQRAAAAAGNSAVTQSNAIKQLQAQQKQKQEAAAAAQRAAQLAASAQQQAQAAAQQAQAAAAAAQRVQAMSAAAVPAPAPVPGPAPAPALRVSDYLGVAPITVEEATPPRAPSEDFASSFRFIVNNLSESTVAQRVKLATDLPITPAAVGWIGHFLVTQRVATYPKFHDAILAFVVGLGMPRLTSEVLRYSYLMARELLLSNAVIVDTVQRTKLKNLGRWIGKLTLQRNKPVLHRDLDLKHLLFGAYESGRLIAAIPFITKVLDGAQRSRVFRPPNPWTMAHLSALKEIYELKDLKMFLQFEVENLCRSLAVELTSLPQGDGLSRCTPPRVLSSGDFKTDGNPKLAVQGVENEIPKPARTALGSINVVAILPKEFQLDTMIPNLAAYVNVPSVALFKKFPQLLPAVSLAVDRAIREIIQPVVERSVTIACKTTKDLILKDFAMEPDAELMKRSSQLMVTKLAGNLALVTCKEPLRLSIENHLQKLLTAVIVAGSPEEAAAVIKPTARSAALENLDLGCMLIEKAATEKAIHDVDEQLSEATQARARHAAEVAAAGGKPKAFLDPTYKSPAGASALQFAQNLPVELRPSPGGLTPTQQKLYEAFDRLPTHRLRMAPNSAGGTSSPAPASQGLQQVGAAGGASSSWDGSSAAPGAAAAAAAASAGPAAVGRDGPGVVDFNQLSACLQQLCVAEEQITAAAAKSEKENPLTLAEANPDVRRILHTIRSFVEAIPATVATPPPALLQFASVVFNELVRLRLESTLQFQLRLAVLSQLRPESGPISAAFVQEITSFLIAAAQDPKAVLLPRKHHALTVGLARTKLLAVDIYDRYLASSVVLAMKNSNRSAAMGTYELAVHVCASCSNEQTVPVENFQNTIRALSGAAKALAAAVASDGNTGDGAIDKDLLDNLQCDVQTLVRLSSDPQMKARAALLLDRWVEICSQNNESKEQVVTQYLADLQRQQLLVGNTVTKQFFKTLLRLSVFRAMQALGARAPPGTVSPAKAEETHFASPAYVYMDSLARLVLLIVKCAEDNKKVYLFQRILSMFTEVLVQEYDTNRSRGADWDQRPYLRIFVSLLNVLATPDKQFAGTIDALIKTVAVVLHRLRPSRYPAFAFAWLELVSHRTFMPRLLRAGRPVTQTGTPNPNAGWFHMQQLMLDVFEGLEPHLRYCRMTRAVRTLYQGTLRVVLVLLHDFPEFLCDFHFSFCDVIPATCIQLRNLLLSVRVRPVQWLWINGFSFVAAWIVAVVTSDHPAFFCCCSSTPGFPAQHAPP